MKQELKRREFLSKLGYAGVACGAFIMSYPLQAANNFNYVNDDIDPKKLNFCGYVCPQSCLLLKGTTDNNAEIKRKGYETFKIKEKFGIEFDADKIFCWGCKPVDKPLGITVKGCTVRNCAIGKGVDCCIECNELSACNKELWTNFPKFKEKMVETQKKYQNQVKAKA